MNKQAHLFLVLAAAAGIAPACDSQVPPAPSAAAPVPAPEAPRGVEVPAVAAARADLAAPAAAKPAATVAAPVSSSTPAPLPTKAVAAAEPAPAAALPSADGFFPADVVLTTGPSWTAPAGRSPLGRPGETTPAPALRLGEVATVAPETAVAVVPWDEAHRHVGKEVTVEGRIVNTHRSRSRVVFLNFHEDWKGKFYIPVFRSAWARMPTAAETFFLNKTVRVTGKVALFNGAPNIAVNDLSQISVVSSGR